MELKGSRTEKNLWAAFNAESAARTRYDIYAQALRAAGQEALARLFRETAANEFTHAGIWFGALGLSAEAADALAQAAAGEHEEWTRAYAEFEQVAREEGFTRIAAQFAMTAKVEATHEAAFLRAADDAKPAAPVEWKCLRCGYTAVGTTPPKVCPLCGEPCGGFAAP